MKDNTRGQAPGFPLWPGAVVVVMVSIYVVGQTILDAMSAQLPSGQVILCGNIGGCGYAPMQVLGSMIPLAFLAIFGLVFLGWQVAGLRQR